MNRFNIRFDFDAGGEAPTVFICDEHGTAYVEVIEEPLFQGEPFDENDPDGFSWDDEDWSPGPLAERILGFLNSGEQL